MLAIMLLNLVLLLDSKKEDFNPQMIIPEHLNSLLLKRKVVSRKMLQYYNLMGRLEKHEFTMHISYFRVGRFNTYFMHN